MWVDVFRRAIAKSSMVCAGTSKNVSEIEFESHQDRIAIQNGGIGDAFWRLAWPVNDGEVLKWIQQPAELCSICELDVPAISMPACEFGATVAARFMDLTIGNKLGS